MLLPSGQNWESAVYNFLLIYSFFPGILGKQVLRFFPPPGPLRCPAAASLWGGGHNYTVLHPTTLLFGDLLPLSSSSLPLRRPRWCHSKPPKGKKIVKLFLFGDHRRRSNIRRLNDRFRCLAWGSNFHSPFPNAGIEFPGIYIPKCEAIQKGLSFEKVFVWEKRHT